jgi:VanZ family protein
MSWIIFAAIVAMTLGPLNVRPTTPFSPNFDRLAGFLVLGLFFALAYPRRIYLLAFALVATAGGLEWAQSFVPGRDGRVEDFLFKAAGAIVGLVIAHLMQPTVDRHLSRRRW